MSSLTVEDDQKWLPTHVQVTVLKGRGLRGKGKHGTSDVYTIIQLGKEKYWTCVAEKTTEPEWREECSFELQPGVLDNPGRSGYPAGSDELVLTVMHRALIGLDVFLGQAVIRLDKVFLESRCVKNEWYRLNSKTGKKEKERGDIQVSIQFTRNNLTASMYDLVMKDKGTSTFSKLKERMKGKRRSSDEDSSSAVLPGGYGSLYRMRQRLPSDGGGEEDYEDDEGGEVRRSKMRTFFLRGKLRKSSDTRSSTSLGSESSESSSRGGSLSPTAGISVVVSDLSNSPSNSSNLTADNSPEHTANTSPRSASLTCDFGETTIAVPRPPCANGSHANVPPPGSGRPADSSGLGPLQKSVPLSMSLQNLGPRASSDPFKGPAGDGRRWSFDRPGEEEKAAIAAALRQSGAVPGERSATEADGGQGLKQRRNLFSQGRGESAGKGQSRSRDESEQAPPAWEEKQKGWFGSKDSHKPSPPTSPKPEPGADPCLPPPPLPHRPSPPPLHHTNPFHPAPPISPCNPFFSLLQQNPFFEHMLTTQPDPPPPCLSRSRPPAVQLFPDASPTAMPGRAGGQPLPPPLSRRLSQPSVAARTPEAASQWDESFEAFAAGRLQPPEGRRTQRHAAGDPPVERRDAQTLETIPEHMSCESDGEGLAASSGSPSLDVFTGVPPAPGHGSSPPDPGSSGLAGSAEEDFLSCLSASSCEEAAAQNLESGVLGKPSDPEGNVADRRIAEGDAFPDVTGRPESDRDRGAVPAAAEHERSSSCPSPDVRRARSDQAAAGRGRSLGADSQLCHACDSQLCHACDSQLCADPPARGGLRCGRGTDQADGSEDPFCGPEEVGAAPRFVIGGGLEGPPQAQADASLCCNPSLVGGGGVPGASACPQAQPAPLQRSHSEGTLTPSFDGGLLPSFGSDPGAVKEPCGPPPGPELLCLSSRAFLLPPESLSPPVALSSLPAFANASGRSASSAAPDAAPRDPRPRRNSPHPVRPLTTAMLAEEKRTEGRSVLATGLEKLKSTIHPGRSSQPSEQEAERRKGQPKALSEGAGSYYHLTHGELIALLLQREAELATHKAAFERHKVLLAKRELELRRLKPQVRDLEDYIDTLLVRIMEQKPTLLQVRSKFK